MRLRSVVTVPAGEQPGEALLSSPADALLFTLADSRVPIETARTAAVTGIRAAHDAGKIALVCVNHPRTELLENDLEVVVSPALAGALLAHTANPQDVRDAAVLLRKVELGREIEPGHVALFPVIDTARGLMRAVDIVDAAPRVAGLAFDADAYALDVGGRAEENGPRFAYARGVVVAASRASDREPLVYSSGLEVRFLAQHGFAGAVVDDVRYADAANQAFTPGPSAVKRARRHIESYEAARGEGAFVARVETEMADGHSARKARQTLELSEEQSPS